VVTACKTRPPPGDFGEQPDAAAADAVNVMGELATAATSAVGNDRRTLARSLLACVSAI